MADREAFEAWRDSQGKDKDWYVEAEKWAAWQAAVAQTARECAKICEQQWEARRGLETGTAYECVQAICERFGIKE